jgi:flagella basal body P-ring formation protein FlgA
MILTVFVFAAVAHSGCVAVSSDKILARDVRDFLPFLQGLDPETAIGFAPRPSTQRILSARELILIARKHGLDLAGTVVPSICVEREARPISPEEIRATLLAAIQAADVEMELIDFSKETLPPGKLEFKPAHLGRPLGDNPEIPVIWRGVLRYDLQSSIPIWARVKVSVGRTVIVASEDIPAGTAVSAAQVKEIRVRQFPFLAISMQSSDAIIGKIARRLIPAGQQFTASALDEASDIAKGDRVRVKVIDGSATLSLDAVAESSGKKGASILVHNPSTGKNFRAVVEEKGKATVRSSPAA